MANQYEWTAVNHFPYLQVVANPENNPCIQTVTRSSLKCKQLFTGALLTFHEHFMQTVRKFLRKVANKQTNNDNYITSLAEVTIKALLGYLSPSNMRQMGIHNMSMYRGSSVYLYAGPTT